MIRELLSTQSILLELPDDRRRALAALVEASGVRPEAELLEALLESSNRPEGAAGAVLFPHATSSAIRTPRIAIGLLATARRRPAPFRVLALLLTPEGDPERGLALLSRLAALLPPLAADLATLRSSEKIRQRIARAESEASGPTYFNLSERDLALELSTDLHNGLSSAEAARRLRIYGRNQIQRSRRTPMVLRLARSFFSFFATLLWAAAALCFIPGVDMPQLGVAILIVVAVNGVFSFLQEARTDRAVETLQRLLSHRCRVVRDGIVQEIDAELVTPGDVLVLEQGDATPADARLIEAYEVEVDNSSLTGESASAKRYKSDRAVLFDGPFLWIEMPNIVFAGSSLLRGSARAVVFGVGMNTEIGRIAGLTQSIRAEDTPLQRQLRGTVKVITLLAAGLGAVFLLLGWQLAGLTFVQALVFCIGLFVANVPEGLLPTVTLSLALGVQRMARRNAIVKNLSSVETLGCTTVICTDKTGTLTQNVMSVVEIFVGGEQITVEGSGYEPRGRFLIEGRPLSATELAARGALGELFRCASACNNARLENRGDDWLLSGDPTEGALMALALKGNAPPGEAAIKVFPFESVRKRMSVVTRAPQNGGVVVYAKGAPLELLERCDRIHDGNKVVDLDENMRQRLRAENDRFAVRGLRIIALAYRLDSNAPDDGEPGAYSQEMAENNLIFLGITALHDPVRPQVPESIRACHAAGIRLIMVTGDYARTAESIGRQIGVNLAENAAVLSGADIAAIDDQELSEQIATGDHIFARVSPEQKLRIVTLLKERGEIVAVTGDGVNDAPALKRAHIGIAMGKRGSDVAREAAHMVLADDNFSSIVAAIEEGRAIFRNIRRFIAYVLNSNPQEMAPYIVWMLFPGAPLAMTVMGVLAVDVGTDLVPAMGLGVEPPERDVMKRPPRKQSEKMLTLSLILKSYLVRGAILTAACYATYLYFGWALGLFADGWSLFAMPASPAGLDMTRASQQYLMSLSAFFIPTVTTQIANVMCKRSTTQSLFSRDFLVEERRSAALHRLRRLPPPRWLARTGARLFSGFMQWLAVILERHWFVMNLVSNPLITFGIAFELIFLLLLIHSPLNQIYFFAPVGWDVYLAALLGPAALLAFDETVKYFRRRGRRLKLLVED